MSDNKQPTLLFVDDDENIVSALRRLTRKQDYIVLTATSGEAALDILASHKVHLVVSDMKMPQMNGAQLFAEIARQYPDTYRIILSGYADLASTIDAVNEGKIHRFLQKPWQNFDLLEAINEGLESVRLRFYNERLKREIACQNKALKTLNEGLEEKVNLRTRQIQLALKKLQIQNLSLEKVLYNMVIINPHLSGEYAKLVSDLARRIAIRMNIKEQALRHIGLAGLLCEMGLMTLDPFLYSKPFEALNHQQRTEFLSQTETAKLLLAPAEHMSCVSKILEQQFLPWSGSDDPDKPAYTAIHTGARILNIARDYWAYRMKKMRDADLTHEQVLGQMKKQTGAKYDPEIMALLAEIDETLFELVSGEGRSTASLEPGMILKSNLYTPEHILILSEGHQLTESGINKLKQMEEIKGISLKVDVECQDQAAFI